VRTHVSGPQIITASQPLLSSEINYFQEKKDLALMLESALRDIQNGYVRGRIEEMKRSLDSRLTNQRPAYQEGVARSVYSKVLADSTAALMNSPELNGTSPAKIVAPFSDNPLGSIGQVIQISSSSPSTRVIPSSTWGKTTTPVTISSTSYPIKISPPPVTLSSTPSSGLKLTPPAPIVITSSPSLSPSSQIINKSYQKSYV